MAKNNNAAAAAAATSVHNHGYKVFVCVMVAMGIASTFGLLTGFMKIELPTANDIGKMQTKIHGTVMSTEYNNNHDNDNNELDEEPDSLMIDNDANSCLDRHGPLPIILMTLGRSGSASTWQIVTNITGFETRSVEYTGSGRGKAQAFMEHVIDIYGPKSQSATTITTNIGEIDMNHDYGDWLVDYLCKQQKSYPQAGVVGFKWKPFPEYFYSKPGQDALHHIVKNKNIIKVIRSRRNILDVYMSGVKHAASKIPAHCSPDDEECITKHQQASSHQVIPSVDKLYDKLMRMWTGENNIDRTLHELKVPTVHVSFEKLYFPASPQEGIHEWKKIFTFILGENHDIVRQNMTWETITHAMGHAATSTMKPHSELLENYDEVYAVLKGTELEPLIRL